MEEKILAFIQFGMRLLYMWTGLHYLFHVTRKRIWMAGVGFFVFSTVLFACNLSGTEWKVWMNLIIISTCIFAFQPPEQKSHWWLLCYLFLLVCLEEFVLLCVSAVSFWVNVTTVYVEVFSEVLCLLFALLLSYCLNRWRRFVKEDTVIEILRNSMIPLIFFLAVEMVVVIISLNELSYISGNTYHDIISTVLSILSITSLGILFVIVLYVRNANDRMNQLLTIKEEMQILQKTYYETLLEKEEATRKYRHDMTNHLLCLNRLARKEDCVGVCEYIEELGIGLRDIQKKSVYTGNSILDILLSYYTQKLEENVCVTIQGKCMGEMSISDVDLCVVFGNLIQNAVEAIEKSLAQSPYLTVQITTGTQYVQVMIENSMNRDSLQFDKKGRLVTTKKDKKNHGMGSQNLEDTIAHNKGRIRYSIREESFTCEVVLPIKNDRLKG